MSAKQQQPAPSSRQQQVNLNVTISKIYAVAGVVCYCHHQNCGWPLQQTAAIFHVSSGWRVLL